MKLTINRINIISLVTATFFFFFYSQKLWAFVAYLLWSIECSFRMHLCINIVFEVMHYDIITPCSLLCTYMQGEKMEGQFFPIVYDPQWSI